MTTQEFLEQYYVERKGTNSLKWDALDSRFGDSDLIAMWVADMEFAAPKQVVAALVERASHGAFGYSFVPDSYYEAFINWEKERHGFKVRKEQIRISPGVVAALYWFVNTFTEENDSIIILTPVYYPFLNSIKDNNRKPVTCDLINHNGQYIPDYEAFEKKIVDNQAKMFILCSPHNPVGRVWKEEELDRLLGICEKHGVLVISDEIHQDFTMTGYKHIPAALVNDGRYSDNVITVTAPSKTFNLAACLNSNVIITDEKKRKAYDAYQNKVNKAEPDLFGTIAAEAAYTYGGEWKDALVKVVEENYIYVKDTLAEACPKIVVAPLEGTYLLWVDLRAYIALEDIKDFVQNKCRLAVDYGEWFGDNFEGFIRLNLGTHPKFVKRAVRNMVLCLKSEYF